MKKVTVGKVATDLAQKQNSDDRPLDVMAEMHHDFEKQMHLAVESGKKIATNTYFFVVIVTKKEPLFTNVYRDYFIVRHTCPTPDYDQIVYRYNSQSQFLEFIWAIPSKDACLHLQDNALLVTSNERELLQFVLDFADGTLFKLAKKLNGEKADPLSGVELEA